MGYYLTTEPENAVPPKSWVMPKTHVPGSRVKERGHRYYSPETGRWVSRDPLEELLLMSRTRRRDFPFRVSFIELAVDYTHEWPCHYVFVRNTPEVRVDFVGLWTVVGCCNDEGISILDCNSICKAFIKRGTDMGGGGGVVCYKGVKCACAFPWFGYDPDKCPIIKAIILQHEEGHKEHVKCTPEMCLERPKRPKKEVDVEECKLRKKTLDQLKSLPGVLPPDDCEKYKKELISALEEDLKGCP